MSRWCLLTQKIANLPETLNGDAIWTDAADLSDRLIENVTIKPDGADGPEADVVADVTDLAAWSTNDNAARVGGGVLFYGVGCGGRI